MDYQLEIKQTVDYPRCRMPCMRHLAFVLQSRSFLLKNEKYLFADEKTEGVTCNQKVYKSPESRCQSGLRDFFCQKTVKLGILSALSSIEC